MKCTIKQISHNWGILNKLASAEEIIETSQEEMTGKGHCIHKLTDVMVTCSRPAQDRSRHHSNTDGERTHKLTEGDHFSLKMWPLAGCQALVESTVPMCIQEALIGPSDLFKRRQGIQRHEIGKGGIAGWRPRRKGWGYSGGNSQDTMHLPMKLLMNKYSKKEDMLNININVRRHKRWLWLSVSEEVGDYLK